MLQVRHRDTALVHDSSPGPTSRKTALSSAQSRFAPKTMHCIIKTDEPIGFHCAHSSHILVSQVRWSAVPQAGTPLK